MNRTLVAQVKMAREDAVVTETVTHVNVASVRVGTSSNEVGLGKERSVEIRIDDAELLVLVHEPGQETECVYSELLR